MRLSCAISGATQTSPGINEQSLTLCWLLGSSVQKSTMVGAMISLSEQSLMLVHCHLNGVRCTFLLKGPLHCITQKGFGTQDGPKEESGGSKRSVGLSTSSHHFIPQGRTTSLRVCMCRQRALATCTIGPASLLVLALPLHFSSRNGHEKPCQASSSRHSCLESMRS